MKPRGVEICKLGDHGGGNPEQIHMKLLLVKDLDLMGLIWRFFPFTYRTMDRSALLLQVCRERKWKPMSDSSTSSGGGGGGGTSSMSMSSSSPVAGTSRSAGSMSGRSTAGSVSGRSTAGSVSGRSTAGSTSGSSSVAGGSTKDQEFMIHQSWNFWWRTSPVKVQNRRMSTKLHLWQTINHIPNTANYCKKDVLVRYLRRMAGTYGSLYDFCPVSFNLPTEYNQLVSEHRKRKGSFLQNYILSCDDDEEDEDRLIWIAKPVGKSQGKGIFVFERCSDLRYDAQYVVQKYIHPPYLINGYKWDLRLYCCITCNNPLTVYSYEEGIARFATSKYNLTDLTDTFSHLTNSSLNRQSPAYYKNKDSIGTGSKWTLSQLRSYFKRQNVDDYALWQQIWSIMVLTIIGDGKLIGSQVWEDNGFQFVGFDILVDGNLKPHLLEVNLHPGLGSGSSKCSVDADVKVPMLHEMFDLLGFPDGREYPEPAIPSMAETTNQLCARIMKAAKGSESLNRTLLLSPLPESMRARMCPVRHLTPIPQRPSTSGAPKPSTSAAASSSTARSSLSYEIGQQIIKQPLCLNSQSINPFFFPKVKPVIKKGPSVLEYGNRSRSPNPMHWLLDGLTSDEDEDDAKPPFEPVIVGIPVLKKSTVKMLLPINGPGMSFLPRQWYRDSPRTCGKWVRIFPFDKTTCASCCFTRPNDCRDSINRVGFHLQTLRDVIDQARRQRIPAPREDSFYDDKLQGQLNTKIWHPSIQNPN